MATSKPTHRGVVTMHCEVCGEGTVMPAENARHKRALGIAVICTTHDSNFNGWLPKWARDKRNAYLNTQVA